MKLVRNQKNLTITIKCPNFGLLLLTGIIMTFLIAGCASENMEPPAGNQGENVIIPDGSGNENINLPGSPGDGTGKTNNFDDLEKTLSELESILEEMDDVDSEVIGI